MFLARVHKHPDEIILAVCDAEIIGETFRGGGLRIDVSRGFYGGDETTEEELLRAFGNATVINLVGNRAVELAVNAGIVDPARVIVIGGVKHAQAVIM